MNFLRHFDVIKGVSPEYMHLALLGVSKLVLGLWLKLSTAMHANQVLIEERIKQIEVPSEICREPRGINEIKHWKGKQVHQYLSKVIYTWLYSYYIASEYRAWTLFYALPVLSGILEADYFQHFVLFSEALWLLLQSTVPLEDIEKAELLLQKFCSKFSALYGMYISIRSWVYHRSRKFCCKVL